MKSNMKTFQKGFLNEKKISFKSAPLSCLLLFVSAGRTAMEQIDWNCKSIGTPGVA